MNLVILMPVYNDWEAAGVLIEQIDSLLESCGVSPIILLINDGSTMAVPIPLVGKPLRVVTAIEVVYLKRNLGHQRAIATGLTHIYEKLSCKAVLIMDSDGQDRSEDIPRLIEKFRETGGSKVIFGKRTRRMETPSFKILYRCYQILHRVLTGMGIHVGNFSIVPFHFLSALVVSPELWNHYAAAVLKLRLPRGLVEAPRGKRLSGQSRMNLVSLVIHGLSAISVFGEIVATRMIIGACNVGLLLAAGAGIVAGMRFFTNLTIPVWVTYTGGLLLAFLVLIVLTTLGFVFSVLSSRNMASFLPIRDCSFQIQGTKRIYGADETRDL